MYTLEKVLELVNASEDIYCELYKGGRYISEGWVWEMYLKPDRKIEAYRLEHDENGDEYLVLHLA